MPRALCIGLSSLLVVGQLLGTERLDLAGVWRVRLDPEDQGLSAQWFASQLVGTESIELPTTTDLAGLGFPLDPSRLLHTGPFPVTTRFPGVKPPVQADEHGYLVRRHLYVGPAWYEREIDVPKAWQGHTGVLCLERAMWKTDVWVDGRWVGECDSLVAEHRYDLGVLEPGRHRLTIRVDNRMIHNISTITHAYGPETQTRWNGLLGDLVLEAEGRLALRAVSVYPRSDRRAARVVVRCANNDPTEHLSGSMIVQLYEEEGVTVLAGATVACSFSPGAHTNGSELRWDVPAQAWDEFHPVRYRVVVRWEGDAGEVEERTVRFGFRHLEREGRVLRVNGRRVFLRGTLDCAVYPRIGHPPMTVPEWEERLGRVKAYGFNHVRFHTWCPPEAAFEAADRLGLYLQPETPAWIDDWGIATVTQPLGVGRDAEVVNYLHAEMIRISETYGNHPSFALFSLGNEFGLNSTDWERVNVMVEEIKRLDPRRLYSGCAARKHLMADDFWVTHHTGVGTRGIGPAHTDWDFSAAAVAAPVPLIAHETGQRPVFPAYDTLLPKFTGPLLPLNLERHRQTLVANGLERQTAAFVQASARFQFTQYKAEHEGMLRTPDYSGYQLLMLSDFTGQSEALVGILDPFGESKGIVSETNVRSWNAPTVVLARVSKFIWISDETFDARLEVAHYGGNDLPAGSVRWSLTTTDRRVVGRGEQATPRIPAGGLTQLGGIAQSLHSVRRPSALVLSVDLGGVSNRWNMWVYPPVPPAPEPAGVWIAEALDEQAMKVLRDGGRVLLLAHGLKNPYTAQSRFESVYWSAGWWGNRFSSLGVLCDPHHPALQTFPNEGRSDWQWQELTADGTTFDLQGAPAELRPIVQAVPDFHFSRLLAQVFEARVGQGSLLVCGYDLVNDLDRRPAARQFRHSLFDYVASPAFQPGVEVPSAWIQDRCGQAGLHRLGARVVRVDSEDRANGHGAENVLDGDPSTFWHSRWQSQVDPLPHELVIDLGRTTRLQGVIYSPRQDQTNGRIARAEVFTGAQDGDWGVPVAEWTAVDDPSPVTIPFPQAVSARFLRIVVRSEVHNQAFASIAELEVIPVLDPE